MGLLSDYVRFLMNCEPKMLILSDLFDPISCTSWGPRSIVSTQF